LLGEAPSAVVADASRNGGTRCAFPTANTIRQGGRFDRPPNRFPRAFYPSRGGGLPLTVPPWPSSHALVPDPSVGPNLALAARVSGNPLPRVVAGRLPRAARPRRRGACCRTGPPARHADGPLPLLPAGSDHAPSPCWRRW